MNTLVSCARVSAHDACPPGLGETFSSLWPFAAHSEVRHYPLRETCDAFPEIPVNTRGLLWAAQENSETPLSCLLQVAFPCVNFLLTDPQQLGLISG